MCFKSVAAHLKPMFGALVVYQRKHGPIFGALVVVSGYHGPIFGGIFWYFTKKGKTYFTPYFSVF